MNNKLIKLGYQYNYNESYLFRSIYDDKISAISFYQNGKFEFHGDKKLIKKLKEELKNENIQI